MQKANIIFLIYDSVSSLDLFGPLQVFECANIIDRQYQRDESYGIFLLSVKGNQVRTSSGASIATICAHDVKLEIDTLIIPGGSQFERASKDEAYISLLKELHDKARRTVSICNAAFILAECGLLDGKKVTTHWMLFDLFNKKYPTALLDCGATFVNDGKIWTSAGISTGIDLCLELVNQDYGHDFSFSIAKFLVVFLHRSGEQPQISDYLKLQSKSSKFSNLIEWLNSNLHEKIQTKNLATRMNMSERSFIRHFINEFGLTPAKMVAVMRIEKARFLLAETNYSLKKIAYLCGFYDEHLLRKKFMNKYNQKPLAYRHSFRTAD